VFLSTRKVILEANEEILKYIYIYIFLKSGIFSKIKVVCGGFGGIRRSGRIRHKKITLPFK
jgi:hypothetical protein